MTSTSRGGDEKEVGWLRFCDNATIHKCGLSSRIWPKRTPPKLNHDFDSNPKAMRLMRLNKIQQPIKINQTSALLQTTSIRAGTRAFPIDTLWQYHVVLKFATVASSITPKEV